MKQVELMVGDWVKLDFYDSPNDLDENAVWKTGKITAIHHGSWVDIDFNGKIEDDIEVEDIVPIPLTDEILIGFMVTDGEKDDYTKNFHQGYSLELEDRKLWIGKWWNGETREAKREGNDIAEGWWEVVVNENLPGKFEGGVKVRYVHELQHALRLFGIEKEIAL